MSLVTALTASVGHETRRFASMIGSFAFIWKFTSNYLYFKSQKHLKRNGAIAGALAGLSVMIETPANRLVISQQFFLRAAQGAKNALKQRNLFSFPHGDTMLFCVAVASIMYAYTMRPDTIPHACNHWIYLDYNWIVKYGRIPKTLVEMNRENTNANQAGIKFGKLDALKDYYNKIPPTAVNRQRFEAYLQDHGGDYLPHLPCSVLHSKTDSCIGYCWSVWWKTFVDMIPVYFSLNAVPLVAFKYRSVREEFHLS
jgi:hypothetical protein